MNTIDKAAHNEIDYALSYAWGKYRIFAHTSQKNKNTLSNWRRVVVILGISGAFLGLLCQDAARVLEVCNLKQTTILCTPLQVIWGLAPDFLKGSAQSVPKILGIMSAFVLGLATYFGKELVSPEKEREWIRSRSTAESLKAEVYKFLTGTTPYDEDDNAELLLEETEKLLESVKDIPTVKLDEKEKEKGLPFGLSSVDDYIKARIDEQIEGFYRPKSETFTKKMEQVKHMGLILGVLVIFLGALGTNGWTAGWVALITTITASITAYAYAGRFQYLIISYQATANRLELLRTRWQASGMTDTHAKQRNRFILDCEEAISIENSAWMAELIKVKKKKA